MISFRNFIWVGLVGLSLMACGSDDNGGVNPADCAAVGAKAKTLATGAGCNDTSADITSTCKQLYAAKLCVSEWEKLINCISPKSASDFQCNSDNEFEPKSTVCTAEQTAFNTCISNAT